MNGANDGQLLKGVTVADFSHVMAGPYASHLMRMMGARVIKIEPKAGDGFRNYGPDREWDGMAPAFIAANAGKQSIALDLKDPADRDIARRIVERSDVLLENFRPGVIDRLGFGYDAVKTYNPGVVFCSISGYGQTGPYSDWPAIDNIVQATSGMMMLGGDEGDPPVRIGFPIVDTLTGQTAALGILSALLRRKDSGEGAYIDVAMFDASLAFMTSALTPFLTTGQAMPRMGNTGYSGLPTAALFRCADGREISLGVVQDNQFCSLAKFLGRMDWLDNPDFATSQARRENFSAMQGELADEFLKCPAAQWEAELSGAGIPCGMVRFVTEAEQLAGEASLHTLPIAMPSGARLSGRIPGPGFHLPREGTAQLAPPPVLDGDRAEILRWLDQEAG